MEEFNWVGDGHLSFSGSPNGALLQVWTEDKTQTLANIHIGMAFNSETGYFYLTYKNLWKENQD